MSETTTTDEPISVRYDVFRLQGDDILVIRAGSAHTQYDVVITRLEGRGIAGNRFVVALTNLSPAGYVWILPHLTGWHWSYLGGGRSLNEVTARTVAKILNDAGDEWLA